MRHIPYADLGHVQHGWLDARHHFSFGQYYDANRMGFGTLRVINDDTIKAGSGFARHPHIDMEIITYVRSGAITHTDSNGNKGRTEAGDVQVMSAGTGIHHSEHNHEDVDTTLYQIWITPNKIGAEPSWSSFEFPKQPTHDKLTLLVSGDGQAPLQINQDAFIYAGNLAKDTELTQAIKHQAYMLVAKGEVQINGLTIAEGDGLEVEDEGELVIFAQQPAEILVIDAPAE